MEELEYIWELLDAIRVIAKENVKSGKQLLEEVSKNSEELTKHLEQHNAKELILKKTMKIYKDSENVVSSYQEFVKFLSEGEKIESSDNILNAAWKGDLYGKKGIKALKKLCKELMDVQRLLEKPFEKIMKKIV